MTLPVVPIPEEKVPTPGGPVLVRGLTASEADKVRRIYTSGDLATFQATVISMAAAVTKAEAKAWVESTPAGVVNDVVAVVHRLSGLDEGAGKSDEVGPVDG